MHKRLVGLDVIRGFAIALVLLRHAWPQIFGSGGIVGVVAFFALSGYLITGLLVRDISRSGRVHYTRFYRNRALRLLPPLALMLVALAVVTATLDPLNEKDGLARALIIGATYTANMPIDLGSSGIDHLWTLATEEQFYILWPLLLTFAIRRRITARVVVIASALLLVTLILTIVVVYPDVHRVYRLPTSWSLAMVIGASTRIWKEQALRLVPTSGRARAALGVVGAVALIGLSLIPDGKESPAAYLLLGPAIAVITAFLVLTWSSWAELPSPWLKPILSLGTISYAAYLWNYPIVLWLGVWMSGAWTPVLTIVATIAAALASWVLVEVPAQRWRTHLDSRIRAEPDGIHRRG